MNEDLKLISNSKGQGLLSHTGKCQIKEFVSYKIKLLAF